MKIIWPALLVSISLSASNIVSSARIEVNNISINKGCDVSGLVKLSGFPWNEKKPFKPGETLQIWFEGEKMPTLSSVRFAQAFDRLADAKVEYFNGVEWIKGPTFPMEKTSRGEELKGSLKFDPEIKARALRITILKTLDLDHDVLNLGNWDIQGKITDSEKKFNDISLRLFTEKPFNTFTLPEKGKILAEIANNTTKKKNLHISMEFHSYFGQSIGIPILKSDLVLEPGEKHKMDFEFTGKKQGPFRASLTISDAETRMPYEIKRLAFGMRDNRFFKHSEIPPLDKPGTFVKSWKERMAEKGTVWGADVTQGMSGNGRIPGERIFRELKRAGATEVYCALAYHDFEPMPGVYHFDYFDDILRKAAQTGLDVTIGIWVWDFNDTSQRFLKDEIQRDEKGNPGQGWSNCFSPYSIKYRFHARQAMTALVKRYVNSPSVIGWHLHPYGMVDHDAHGIFDYHPDALEAYRNFLQKKYQTLPALNKNYQTNYSSWKEIAPPRPLWETLLKKNRYEEASRVSDVRPVWTDYLNFYHEGPLSLRTEMMEIVRKYDTKRMICGMNASGGTGLAEKNYAALIGPDAFYGDQGLNGTEIIRRFIAKQRYNRPLRIEDISAVTLGRSGFMTKESLTDRAHWDIFQACILGLEHYNYVFPTLDDSVFMNLAFANPHAKKMVNEARESQFVPRKIGLLHSFETDILEGKYNYNGISLYRWWLMNGVSGAFYAPGAYFEIYSDGSPLDQFESMKLIIDDGSHILPKKMIEKLVAYVRNGGKLAMICGEAGGRIPTSEERHLLLKQLGYTAFAKMDKIHDKPALLNFRQDNPVLRKTTGIAVNSWYELEAPKGGSVVGYVEKTPVAVSWKCEKGEVFLIGARPGAIPEAEVMRQFHAKKSKEAWILWNNACRELRSICRSLFSDLAEWAKEPELMRIADDDVSAVLRKKNHEESYLIYLYNHSPEQNYVLSLNLPSEKRWRATALTLSGETKLGIFDSATLSAPGIVLPRLGKNRFLGIRLEPVNFLGL